MRDIEKTMKDQSDSESDCSVRSEDILSSSYPVKPRKTLRMPVRIDKNMLDDDDDDAGIEDGVVEETIDFLKTIEMARREVFEAEREREKYEIKYQVRSLHTRCISDFYREYLNFFCIYAGVKHVLIIDFFLSNTHPHIHSHSSIGTPPLSPPSHTRSTYPYVRRP